MRIVRFVFLIIVSVPFLAASVAQQTPASSAQALALLQQALAALNPGTPTTDVTLSGTAHSIAGGDDETGTATVKAVTGASRIDLNFPSGARSEIQNGNGSSPVGTWSGPDGVAHPISFHNLLTDPVWFFPQFPIAHRISGSGYLVSYVGHETLDSLAVEHIMISQTPIPQTPADTPTITHLSQMDYFLDSTTFLPVALTFSIHPDNNALLDIPIEVRFSDYRAVNGGQVPFRVQRLLNNGLVLDLQFDKALVNTGLSTSPFQVQ